MRLSRSVLIPLFGLFLLLLSGCGASDEELITAVITAEDARTRLIAWDEIVQLEERGIEVFTKLLDFETVKNLFENEVSHARISEMSEEDILREVNDIRIMAVSGMGAIGSIEAAQPLIDATYISEAGTDNLIEPILIGDDELSIELSANFRSEVMSALGQLAFGSDEERERAIDFFSYGTNDPHPAVRASTAGSLAALHLYESGYFLKQLADDEDGSVRAAAFNAIYSIGSYYVDHAERALGYDDTETAELDGVRLKTLKDSVYEHCLSALKDPEPSVRIPAINALNVFDDPLSVTPLMRYLADSNENVRNAVINALTGFESEEGIDAVEKAATAALGEADAPYRRMMAALVLGRMRTGGEAMERALLVPDELWFIKLQLVNSLANLGNTDFLNTVYLFLDDPDWDVRAAAINAVGSLGNKDDLDRLIDYAAADETLISPVTNAMASIADYDDLKTYLGADNDLVRRLIAIEVLSMQSDPENPAPPMLVDLLKDEDIEIVRTALDVVARYDYEDLDGELAALVKRGEDEYAVYEDTKESFEELNQSLVGIYEIKTKAAGMLSSFDNRDGINYFIDMLEDPSAGRRLIGVASLGIIGHPRGVMPTVGLLNDGSDYVRWGAAEVLGIFADNRTTGFLSQATEDPDPWVQESAINSLQAIGNKNTIDSVYQLLERDVEPAVKVAALNFISRLGDKEITDDIAAYLEDDNAGVRFAAATCLTRLNDEKGRGLDFFKEALKSTKTVTLNPGLPPNVTPLTAGLLLLAAELTDTPESQITDFVVNTQNVYSWAHVIYILTDEITTAETYGILAEMTLKYRYLQAGLLANAVNLYPTAYTAFEPYLDNGDMEIRRLGYEILVRIGDDRALERFSEQLTTYPEDSVLIIAAIDAMGAQSELRSLFRTAEEPIRILIAQRFAEWTDKRMPLIWGQIATEDPSLAVRMTVLDALAADQTGVGRVYLSQIVADENSAPELVSAARDALAGLETPPSELETVEAVEE